MMELLLLALAGAILSMDATSIGQLMISRPIVVGPLLGCYLGDSRSGLAIGMIIELVWMNVIPLGTSVIPDVTVVTVLATYWGIWSGRLAHSGSVFGPAELVLGLALALPVGVYFKKSDIVLRRYNIKLMHQAEESLRQGDESALGKIIRRALWLNLVKNFVLYSIGLWLGRYLVFFAHQLFIPKFRQGLEFAFQMLPLVGFGIFLSNFLGRKDIFRPGVR